jgi:hypothetical protein
VSKQVLDRHLVADQRQILPQHRTRGRGHLEPSLLDQAHHGQCGQPLGSAGDTELRVDRVRHFVATMGQTVGLGELDIAASIHPYDAGEPRLSGDPIDGYLQVAHSVGTLGVTSRTSTSLPQLLEISLPAGGDVRLGDLIVVRR